jgi:hypothetical protein
MRTRRSSHLFRSPLGGHLDNRLYLPAIRRCQPLCLAFRRVPGRQGIKLARQAQRGPKRPRGAPPEPDHATGSWYRQACGGWVFGREYWKASNDGDTGGRLPHRVRLFHDECRRLSLLGRMLPPVSQGKYVLIGSHSPAVSLFLFPPASSEFRIRPVLVNVSSLRLLVGFALLRITNQATS